MAIFRGRDGKVKIGSDSVLKIQSWSYTETVAMLDTDSMLDEWMTRLADLKDASGDIVYYMDDTPTGNAQTALTLGAAVTLELYSQGDTTGATYRTGPAIITEISEPVEKGGIVTRTASWVANGEWNTATVAA